MSVEQIARALLYEGYLLYPYRASSLKNRRRWAFGALFPPAWTEEPSSFHGEALLEGMGALSVRVRFLQLNEVEGALEREVSAEIGELPRQIGERSESLPDGLCPAGMPASIDFAFDDRVTGRLSLRAEPIGHMNKIIVELANLSPVRADTRDQAALSALASAHVEVVANGASFISQTDPIAAESCRCEHIWPILIGDPARRDTLLLSPILLEDFPRMAPESPHDLFDSGEIDEILTLRILTLTDAEKAEMRTTDPRARALLERVEALGEDAIRRLHGRLQGFAPGDRVRLRPKAGSDIFDLALGGRAATIVAIEETFEGRRHLAVVLDDDPGKDLGVAGLPGHRFFFSLDEVEPLS